MGKGLGRGAARGARASAGAFAGGNKGKGGAGRAGTGRPAGRKAAPGGKGARAAAGRQQKGQQGPARDARQLAPDKGKGDVIVGRRAVAEALDLGVPIKKAFVLDQRGERDQTLDSLAARLDGEGVEVERVPKKVLDALSSHGVHQGVAARVKPYRYADLSDVIAAAGEGSALVVLLDHVTDEGNFGAIVRSAEVVGAAGVVIAKARAAGVGVGAYKTSAGAVLHLPIAQVPNLATAIEQLQDAGFWVGAATEHAHQSVWEAPLEGRVCLVMGSEGEGISRLVRSKCDFECKLPQRGRIESLNVAQATTVLCYEWLRREMGGAAQEAPADSDYADVTPGGADGMASEADGSFDMDFSQDAAEGFDFGEWL